MKFRPQLQRLFAPMKAGYRPDLFDRIGDRVPDPYGGAGQTAPHGVGALDPGPLPDQYRQWQAQLAAAPAAVPSPDAPRQWQSTLASTPGEYRRWQARMAKSMPDEYQQWQSRLTATPAPLTAIPAPDAPRQWQATMNESVPPGEYRRWQARMAETPVADQYPATIPVDSPTWQTTITSMPRPQTETPEPQRPKKKIRK